MRPEWARDDEPGNTIARGNGFAIDAKHESLAQRATSRFAGVTLPTPANWGSVTSARPIGVAVRRDISNDVVTVATEDEVFIDGSRLDPTRGYQPNDPGFASSASDQRFTMT